MLQKISLILQGLRVKFLPTSKYPKRGLFRHCGLVQVSSVQFYNTSSVYCIVFTIQSQVSFPRHLFPIYPLLPSPHPAFVYAFLKMSSPFSSPLPFRLIFLVMVEKIDFKRGTRVRAGQPGNWGET